MEWQSEEGESVDSVCRILCIQGCYKTWNRKKTQNWRTKNQSSKGWVVGYVFWGIFFSPSNKSIICTLAQKLELKMYSSQQCLWKVCTPLARPGREHLGTRLAIAPWTLRTILTVGGREGSRMQIMCETHFYVNACSSDRPVFWQLFWKRWIWLWHFRTSATGTRRKRLSSNQATVIQRSCWKAWMLPCKYASGGENHLTFLYPPVMCWHILKSFKFEHVWCENTLCLPCEVWYSPNVFSTSEKLICLKWYGRLDFFFFFPPYSPHMVSYSINGLECTFLCETLKKCQAMNSVKLTRLISTASQ